MADDTLTESLARQYAGITYDQIPSNVIAAAKLHILDTLGCVLAGSRLEPGRLACSLALSLCPAAEDGSTIFGTAQRVALLDAIWAMTTAAHCGELDDIHGRAAACTGAMVIPAMLAMAEKYGGDGRRFLASTVVGYETIARLGLAIEAPKLFARGWWPSTVCGAFGVAAAGARFLNWPAQKMVNALGIASLHAGGMLTGGQEGATARHLAFGRASQNGMLALLATEAGFSGPKRALEDSRGLCLTLCAEPKWEFLHPGDKFYLPEVAFKPYPCARQLHAGVEAQLKLLQRHKLQAAAIAEIELWLPTHNAAMVDRPVVPSSRAAMLASAQYVLAVTTLGGKINLKSFEDEYLQSENVRQLAAKVRVTASADLDRHFPKYWPGKVVIKLANGQIHSEEIIVPKGEEANPMTQREVEEKFLELAAPVIGAGKTRSVIAEVQALDERGSLEMLLDALALSK